ncbi:MAG: hypothetical protein L0K86_06595 [Actinomycetia bacterium]|nr:hypothetical protein [Actinomycetes bacterium]
MLPKLREQGVDDASIDTMMVANPRRLFSRTSNGSGQ